MNWITGLPEEVKEAQKELERLAEIGKAVEWVGLTDIERLISKYSEANK